MINMPSDTSLDEFKQIIEQKANPLLIMFLKEVDAFDCFCFNAHMSRRLKQNYQIHHIDNVIVASPSRMGCYFVEFNYLNIFDVFSWKQTAEGINFWVDMEIEFYWWYQENWGCI